MRGVMFAVVGGQDARAPVDWDSGICQIAVRN